MLFLCMMDSALEYFFVFFITFFPAAELMPGPDAFGFAKWSSTDRFKNTVQYHGQLDNNFLVEVLELCDPTRMPKALTATLSPKDKQILWFLAAGSWPWDLIHSQSKADVVSGQHFAAVAFCVYMHMLTYM